MRKTIKQRRRWNYLLMFVVVVFMVLLNLPTLIKQYLIPAPDDQIIAHPYLINPDAELRALHSSQWSLTHQEGVWVLNVSSKVEPQQLAQRWRSLVGTELSPQQFQSLKPSLNSPSSIEVWYVGQDEPQRITYYQLPQFWLLKNWQDKWIAVTVEPSYLLLSLN